MAKRNKYVVYGDMGANYGWVVDSEKYDAASWWRQIFCRNSFILAGGTRAEMHELADKMNADLPNALAILAEWKKNDHQ